MEKKVKKEITLDVLEQIIEKRAKFVNWKPFTNLFIMEIDGFTPNMMDENYVTQLKGRMKDRLIFIENRDTFKGGFDKLPEDAREAMKKVVAEIESWVI